MRISFYVDSLFGKLPNIIYVAGIAKANINRLAAIRFTVLRTNINRPNPQEKNCRREIDFTSEVIQKRRVCN
jgi:hypothetical protein